MSNDSNDVQDILNSLGKSYLAELPAKLGQIESQILSIQSADAFQEQFETLFRQVHSLKGTAGSYGFNIITTICHNFEDGLSATHADFAQFTSTGSSHWLAYIDLLRTAVEVLEENGSNFQPIEEKLVELSSGDTKAGNKVLHALIVSTNQLYEKIFSESFAGSSTNFSFCNDGHEALGRLLNEPFDLLVTDMETPTLNGLALVGALRLSSNRNKYIKSILLTSSVPIKLARFVDPDYAIEKDSKFIDNLTELVGKLIRELTKS